MADKNKEHVVDLQHIEFDKDGTVRLALHRKETQRALWKSMQQFEDIKPTVPNPPGARIAMKLVAQSKLTI